MENWNSDAAEHWNRQFVWEYEIFSIPDSLNPIQSAYSNHLTPYPLSVIVERVDVRIIKSADAIYIHLRVSHDPFSSRPVFSHTWNSFSVSARAPAFSRRVNTIVVLPMSALTSATYDSMAYFWKLRSLWHHLIILSDVLKWSYQEVKIILSSWWHFQMKREIERGFSERQTITGIRINRY